MATSLPNSLYAIYREALITFLEEEAAPYLDDDKAEDISFRFSGDTHGPGTNPQGMVMAFTDDISNPMGLDYGDAGKRFTYDVRLFVSEADEDSLNRMTLNWLGWLEASLEKCRTSGISGTFLDVTVRKALMGSIIRTIKAKKINGIEGGGGTVALTGNITATIY